MKVHVGRNIADLAAVDSNLISQHARCRDLYGVSPIVVVVTEGIGKVQNGILGCFGGV